MSLLACQSKSEINEYGFLAIATDSMDVPFYIDGVFVGQHPLKEPIAVISGFHEVGYIPPEIQSKKINEHIIKIGEIIQGNQIEFKGNLNID